jgi:hypothetical protein
MSSTQRKAHVAALRESNGIEVNLSFFKLIKNIQRPKEMPGHFHHISCYLESPHIIYHLVVANLSFVN